MRRCEGRWRSAARRRGYERTLAPTASDLAGGDRAGARRAFGTARAHKAELRIESNALRRVVDAIGARAAPSRRSRKSPPRRRRPTPLHARSASPPTGRSVVALRLEGPVRRRAERSAGWAARSTSSAQSLAAPPRTWRSGGLRGSYFWSGGPQRASLEPGSAEALGATLRWSRIVWQGGDASGVGARLDAAATIDPMPIAPLLRAVQPDFGWGGDLAVKGRLEVRAAPSVTVDAVIERASGDLTVTDEYGTQQLGLTDLRLGIVANDGVWRFTTALAGDALGVAAGAVTARTHGAAAWPDARTPIEGVLELRIANLAPGADGCRRAGAWPVNCMPAHRSPVASARPSTSAGSKAPTSACATSCRA